MVTMAFATLGSLRVLTVRPIRALRLLSGTPTASWDDLAPSVRSGKALPFSAIIDVRTAAEFAEDHIPGALNLPILSNEERKSVGATYVGSPFEGRRLGAGLLCRNLAAHLESFFADKDANFRPLVYCARGGLRSRGVATILEAIGFKTHILTGGYRSYRAWVRSELERLPSLFEYRVISGYTGCAKSRLLDLLRSSGEQVLHLEALARHKGSVLGFYPNEPQPSQRGFDSALMRDFHHLSRDRPVWLEDESRAIGACHLPTALWLAKRDSPHLMIACPRHLRVDYTLHDYDYLFRDKATLKTRLGWLAQHQPEARIQHWMELIDRDDNRGLVLDLLEHHYDPHYRRSRARTFQSARTKVISVDVPNSLIDRDFLTSVVVPELIRKAAETESVAEE